jgi:hypothetical protein
VATQPKSNAINDGLVRWWSLSAFMAEVFGCGTLRKDMKRSRRTSRFFFYDNVVQPFYLIDLVGVLIKFQASYIRLSIVPMKIIVTQVYQPVPEVERKRKKQ